MFVQSQGGAPLLKLPPGISIPTTGIVIFSCCLVKPALLDYLGILPALKTRSYMLAWRSLVLCSPHSHGKT